MRPLRAYAVTVGLFGPAPWTKQGHQALAATLSTTMVTILLARFTSSLVFALPLLLWNRDHYYY